MPRLLLAALPGRGAPTTGSQEALADADLVLARLARALRDAGQEVVHAGQAVDEPVVAAAAVQEDVAVVVLLAPASYDDRALAAELAGDVPGEADEVALVTVRVGDRADEVVRRVGEVLATGVADDPTHASRQDG